MQVQENPHPIGGLPPNDVLQTYEIAQKEEFRVPSDFPVTLD